MKMALWFSAQAVYRKEIAGKEKWSMYQELLKQEHRKHKMKSRK